MTIHIDCKKHNGLWAYCISAGEGKDLDDCGGSEYMFDTEQEAETEALRFIFETWNVID